MFATMREDIQSIIERDPAAYSKWQVVLLYPGLHAVWMHRLANRLWRGGFKFPAHFLSRFSRWMTGIEIHPGATLGSRLFIDHGMGVVIGETAEIGADVTIYHGVTLGGVSLAKGKRHPTLADGVVVGAGAKILGAITIGKNTRVGANAVVVQDMPENNVVVGIPGKPVKQKQELSGRPDFQHGNLPDILSERLDHILIRLERIDRALIEDSQGPEPDYII